MLIDVKTGEFHLPGLGTYGPESTLAEFRNTDVYEMSRRLPIREPGEGLMLPEPEYKGVSLIIMLLFGPEGLRYVEWTPRMSPHGSTWADWTPELDVKERQFAESVLLEDLGPPHRSRGPGTALANERPKFTYKTIDYHFIWGTTRLMYDGIAGQLRAKTWYVRDSPYYLGTEEFVLEQQIRDLTKVRRMLSVSISQPGSAGSSRLSGCTV